MRLVSVLIGLGPLLSAQPKDSRPKFEDYPAIQTAFQLAPLRLELPAERLIRTRLREANEKPANFAATLRVLVFGCGSNCASLAFIDLKTGTVYGQPVVPGVNGWDRWVVDGGMWEGAGIWGRLDSRLLVIRSGKTWVEKDNRIFPDTYYFVWEGDHFRQLLKVPVDRAQEPKNAPALNRAQSAKP